ncbi:MAG: glycoside hydrolase family 71/99-like protein [Flavisolibacter sp.]
MNTRNPDIIDPNGQREIASLFYPLIGPYASGDSTVIEYQLLLMKLSGIDGVLIDWPGTQNSFDYPLLVRNTEKIVSYLDKVGLQFAIVYEDQNLNNTGVADKIGTAQNDMRYLQANFFKKSNYEQLEGKPLLLVFGPQAITTEAQWSNIFSVLPLPPSFFTLWFQSNKAGADARGEFAWIAQDHITTLNAFYGNGYGGMKFGSAYPGFKTFYAQGGWSGPTWIIEHNGTATFGQTLDLALGQSALPYIQLATWNDYGEGTMIEPTTEFGYGFLTTLQQKLGVTLGQSDLETVAKLYDLRKSKAAVPEVQKQLNQAFYYIVSLQLQKAKDLLATL